jgi:hypothetical protein
MKSSNDIYHGDEHITDKPQKYMVKLSEVIHYEIEVEAMDEEEADQFAWEIAVKDHNQEYVSDHTGIQTDSIKLIKDPLNYNYTLGEE